MSECLCAKRRPCPGRPAFLAAVLAAMLASGAFLGADETAPTSPEAQMGRWRKVVAWEGSFRATQTVRVKSAEGKRTTSLITVEKTTYGHIVLDTVKRTETLPGDKDVMGWTGSTIWTGKATGQVTIRRESWEKGEFTSTHWVASGGGGSQSQAELSIGAVSNVYRARVEALAIDVIGTKTFYSARETRTTPDNGRHWIDINPSGIGALDGDRSSWPGRRPGEDSTAEPLTGPLRNVGLLIRGSYSAHGASVDGTGDRHDEWRQADWTFWPSDEVDLVVDIDGYDEWMPEGNVRAPTQPGNHLEIKATLVTKDGKPSETRKAEKFIFELVMVSQEPGICLNFPVYSPLSAPRDEPDDLFFDPPRQPPGTTMLSPVPERRADLPGGVAAQAVLSSRDFGGYGVLHVSAIMEGGSSELPGHLRDDRARTDILIPHSTDDSIIPLEWKQAKHVANLADDRDTEVKSGYRHPGDGLSVFEEYRGFVARGKHMRTDPRYKTVFVHTTVPHADGGLRLLTAASGLQVVRINRDDYCSNTIRVVNSNSGANHIVAQHGLWIVSANIGDHAGGQSPLGPPKYVDKVEMNIDNATWPVAYRDSTIAHELCHALAVNHHGEGNRWQVYAPGALPLYPLGGDLFIAVQRGEHSGNDTCLMRYSWAHLIENPRDVPPPLVNYGSSEPDGRTLCHSIKGTGVNADPLSKCGDAAPRRGSCLSRITVSDVYPQATDAD